MKRSVALSITALLLLSISLWGRRRDPLTTVETDQLRDVAQEPEKRVPLYVKFIRARALALEQLRTDPRLAADRPSQIHDLLEDIDILVQEMDDNIDVYAEHRADLRKPLKEVIEVDSDLQLKLRALKQGGDPEQAKSYTFVLDNVIDSVNGSLDGARKLIQEQELAFQEAKKKKDKAK